MLALFVLSALLSSCFGGANYNQLNCDIPPNLDDKAVVGDWQLEYQNYKSLDEPDSVRITGTERIEIRADGTYVQSFESPGFHYQGLANKWKLIAEADGPKLAMADLRYFAKGIEFSDKPLTLMIQVDDLVKYYRLPKSQRLRTPKIKIDYPGEGFIYLYPRYCNSRLALVQMVSSFIDPDSGGVHHPVFEKVPASLP